MARAEDLGGYYRIPADNRNLNYNKYFVDGQEEVSRPGIITRTIPNGLPSRRSRTSCYRCSWYETNWRSGMTASGIEGWVR